MVLDRDVPGRHGDEICRDMAAEGRGTRVLMLTAASAVDDRVQGLTRGADDYRGKPFAFRWWVAGRLLRPLHVMTARVRDLSGRSPLGRIALAGPADELKDLADTFDGLLARLDAALAVAGAHGGTVDAQARPDGGLTVRVAIPGVPVPALAPAAR